MNKWNEKLYDIFDICIPTMLFAVMVICIAVLACIIMLPVIGIIGKLIK